jgi:hypothetical protein
MPYPRKKHVKLSLKQINHALQSTKAVTKAASLYNITPNALRNQAYKMGYLIANIPTLIPIPQDNPYQKTRIQEENEEDYTILNPAKKTKAKKPILKAQVDEEEEEEEFPDNSAYFAALDAQTEELKKNLLSNLTERTIKNPVPARVTFKREVVQKNA